MSEVFNICEKCYKLFVFVNKSFLKYYRINNNKEGNINLCWNCDKITNKFVIKNSICPTMQSIKWTVHMAPDTEKNFYRSNMMNILDEFAYIYGGIHDNNFVYVSNTNSDNNENNENNKNNENNGNNGNNENNKNNKNNTIEFTRKFPKMRIENVINGLSQYTDADFHTISVEICNFTKKC